MACPECGVWVVRSDTACFNCGLAQPHKDLQNALTGQRLLASAGIGIGAAGLEYLLLWLFGPTIALLSIVPLLVAWIMVFVRERRDPPDLLTVIGAFSTGSLFLASLLQGPDSFDLGYSVVAGLSGFLATWKAAGRREVTHVPHCLQQSEKLIETTVGELEVRQQRIEDLQKYVAKQATTNQWKDAQKALAKASEASSIQLHKFLAQQRKIEHIRWQNEMEPLADGWQNLDSAGLEERLMNLDLVIARGWELFKRQERHSAAVSDPGKADFDIIARGWELLERQERHPAAASDLGKSGLDDLKRAIDLINQLRKHLTQHQALLLAREVSPVDQAFSGPTLSESLHRGLEEIRSSEAALRLCRHSEQLKEEGIRIEAELVAVAQVEKLVPKGAD